MHKKFSSYTDLGLEKFQSFSGGWKQAIFAVRPKSEDKFVRVEIGETTIK